MRKRPNLTPEARKARAEQMRRMLLRHGHAAGGKSATYRTWEEMIDRCTRRSHTSFRNYGGRGITVCDRWRKFENFLADMGEKPAGLSLDRFPNVDGNYEPGNCRWATYRQQQNNRRNNVYVTLNGVTMTAADLARKFGVDQKLVQERLRRGVSVELAAVPPRQSRFQRRKPAT